MNITGKFLKAWKVEDKGTFKLVDLGDSTKNKDGTYNNFTWYRCLFVSGASQLKINEKDTLEIKSGVITMEKYNDKWSPKVIVFEAEVTASTQKKSDYEVPNYSPKTDPGYSNGGFQDDLPDDLDSIPF